VTFTLNSVLWPYLHLAGFDRYLREIVSTDKLASTRLDDIIEEYFANRVVAGAFTVVKNGKEGCVKLIVENFIQLCTTIRSSRAFIVQTSFLHEKSSEPIKHDAF
jgi:hypothetical protein